MAYFVAWDTETARFGPGRQAPPLSCVSVKHEGGETLIHWSDAREFFDEVLYDPEYVLVGHNIAYDLAVVAAEFPHYLPAIFQLFEDDRVRDTMVRQKLLDIAMGCFRGYYEEPTKEDRDKGYEKGYWVTLLYDLDSVHYRYTRKKLDKNTWRLRYGELRDVRLAEWPAGAREYSRDDARATWTMFWAQEESCQRLVQELKRHVPRLKDPEPLGDEASQLRAAWWIYLMKCWGIRTNPKKVRLLRQESQTTYDGLVASLQEVQLCPVCARQLHNKKCPVHKGATWRRGELQKDGTTKIFVFHEPLTLVRADGVRDTKLAKLRMILAMEGEGKCRRTKKGGIQLDADACTASGDHLLKDYSSLSTLQSVVKKDIPALLKGRYVPIHSNFDTLIATGRTSSSKPNIQNIRVLPGIRECFEPRRGKVFLDADYDGLELRTLAQSCLKIVGFSKLAEVLNAGDDPHLKVAAEILGISYDVAERRFEAGDDDVYYARQTAKVANFGFPGGLGFEALISFAWKAYGVKLTESQARALKEAWMAAFPEMQLYFEHINRLCQEDALENLAVIQQLFTQRIRGNIRYTVACNSYFQGLGSDATKNAGWLIAKACYLDKKSPLYGCRIVNYIHDQFLVECDEDKAHEACLELARLMVKGAAPYCRR
jgi:hypothetical protein